jgi:MFS family permease
MTGAAGRFFRDRRVSLGLAFLANAALGSVYSYGVFRPALEKHWGIGALESGLPYTVFLAAFAFSMPLSGVFIARLGERKAVWLGALLLWAGWALAGSAGDIRSLAFYYGALGGVGVGFAYGGTLSLAARYYPDRKGFAMGVVLAGFGLSPLFTAPLLREAIERAGPVEAFAWGGTALALAVLFFSLFLRRPPAHPHAHTAPGMAALPALDRGPGGMLRSPRFYALWLAFAAACAMGLSVIGITPSFAAEAAGPATASAAGLLMAFAVFNALGRPLFGYLADRRGPAAAGALAFALVCAAAAALWLFPGQRWLFAPAFALFWLCLGAWLAVAPAATAFFFGLAHQARNYGIVYTAYGVGAIAGVTLTSVLRDALGSYAAVMPYLAAAALFFCVFSALALRAGGEARLHGREHRTRDEREKG